MRGKEAGRSPKYSGMTLVGWARFFTAGGLFFGLLGSCNPQPQPIRYGSDQCHFCHMTIVDRVHGAQIVNNKGKAFNYDAVECMLSDLEGFDGGRPQLMLVNHHSEPGALIDATTASYLITEKLPSPMGAFLTAFPNLESAQEQQAILGGETFSWSELKGQVGTTEP